MPCWVSKQAGKLAHSATHAFPASFASWILGPRCAGSDVNLEGLAHQLQAGTMEERGAAAERLFSYAAENERNRSHVALLGVTRPLVQPALSPNCGWICSQAGLQSAWRAAG